MENQEKQFYLFDLTNNVARTLFIPNEYTEYTEFLKRYYQINLLKKFGFSKK